MKDVSKFQVFFLFAEKEALATDKIKLGLRSASNRLNIKTRKYTNDGDKTGVVPIGMSHVIA